MHRVVLISAFAAGLLLALSACGGGTASKSTHAASTTPKATATNTKATATNSKATTQHTATSQTSTTGTAATPATSTAAVKTPGLPATDCRKLARLAAKMGQAFTGRTPAADTRAYAEFLVQLAKTAPFDIRPDFGVLADAYTKIAGAVTAVYSKPGATPSADQLKRLSEVGKELDTGALKHAADNVNTWLQTHCSG